jgi:3-hydroxyisobutyrate dehydrogenase-like beta-hydroxyacid dehydrogenase
MTMKVGFIGLGNMGLPMARNLLKAGHEVTVYNRTKSRAEELRAAGAKVAESVADACECEVVMTMLADDHAVEDVVFGTTFLKQLRPGGVHVSMSTISVRLARRLTDAHATAGSVFVSSPVFGRPPAAEAAQLLVIAAGPPEAIEHCRPLLAAIGNRVEIISADPPAANVFKLAGNFMIAASMEVLGEAFALLRKSNVNHKIFLKTMSETLFAAPIYKVYGNLIAEEKFEPAGFKVPLGLKDVRLVLAAAETVAAPMPVANIVRDHLLTAMARGQQDLDWSSLARVVAENAGL